MGGKKKNLLFFHMFMIGKKYSADLKMPLGEKDIPLGKYVQGYKNCSPISVSENDIVYIASTHKVRARVLIPDGPQGYTLIEVPENIHTLKELLLFLKRKNGFVLSK